MLHNIHGVVMVCALASVACAVDPGFFVTHNTSCIVSTKPPREPQGLEFCHWYNKHSCCIPTGDQNIIDMFTNLMNLGLACSPAKHSVKTTYNPIRDWYCMSCDPHEPRFRFQTKYGDRMVGGHNNPDPNAAEDDFTWRVCKTFIYGHDGKSGLWGTDGSKYDSCGLMTPNPCGNQKQFVFNATSGAIEESAQPVLLDWEDYQCGDNVLVPSSEFEGADEPAVDFMKLVAPPNYDGMNFKFVVTDNTRSDFDWERTPCFLGALAGTMLTAATSIALAVLVSIVLVL
jgi:hypothetical protein